jgi:hypothetical protein
MNVILSMDVMLCIYGCDEYCDVRMNVLDIVMFK